jgi:hypothetical protein
VKSALPIAVDEQEHLVTFSVEKYNSPTPGTGVPGATYDLFVHGTVPPGYAPPPVPEHLSVPDGYAYFGAGTTDAHGALHFRVPSGQIWCVRERIAPPNYLLDHALRCTSAPLLSDPGPTAITLAVPEVSTEPPVPPVVPPVLPETGFDVGLLSELSVTTFIAGCTLVAISHRRSRRGLPMLQASSEEEKP